MSNERWFFPFSIPLKAVLNSPFNSRDVSPLEKSTPGPMPRLFYSLAVKKAFHPASTGFETCINAFQLFGICPRLIQIGSGDKYSIKVFFIIFDVPRWRLCRGANLSSPDISDQMLRIMKTRHSKSDSHFDRDRTYTLSSAAWAKFHSLYKRLFIHSLRSSHQSNIFFSCKHDLACL